MCFPLSHPLLLSPLCWLCAAAGQRAWLEQTSRPLPAAWGCADVPIPTAPGSPSDLWCSRAARLPHIHSRCWVGTRLGQCSVAGGFPWGRGHSGDGDELSRQHTQRSRRRPEQCVPCGVAAAACWRAASLRSSHFPLISSPPRGCRRLGDWLSLLPSPRSRTKFTCVLGEGGHLVGPAPFPTDGSPGDRGGFGEHFLSLPSPPRLLCAPSKASPSLCSPIDPNP